MKPLYSTPIAFKPMKEEPAGHHWSTMKSYKLHLKVMETSKGPYLRVSHTIAENPMEDGVQWINPPYRPGEKCYVREAYKIWFPCDDNGDPIDDHWHVRYKDGTERIMDTGWDEGPHYLTPHDVGLDKEPDAWRSPVTMPMWAARRFVTVLSCEPVKIEDVTEEDIIKAGLADGSCEWANGAARCNAKGDLVVNQFMDKWHKRHPGKEWAWRVESEEEK